jgi:large subunit ribosomal protein L17
MRHLKKGRKLGRTTSHRKALFANMATSLFQHEIIETTDAKAKDLRGVAEKLITLAKRGDLHARRQAYATVRDQGVLKKLFDVIGPRFKERNGGYTRVIKSRVRVGDCASMSVIELLDRQA